MKPLYLALEAVATVVALAAMIVQRLVRDGEFPQPRQLSGRRVAWLVREVEEWAEARPVSKLLHQPTNRENRIDSSLILNISFRELQAQSDIK